MSANTPTLYYLIKLPGSGYAIIPVRLPISIDSQDRRADSQMLGWTVPVKAEVTVNERARMQPDADGYLACHDVGVNASEPSGRTRADRSRSASSIDTC